VGGLLVGTIEVGSIPEWEDGVPEELADGELQECTFGLGSYDARSCALLVSCEDEYRQGAYAAACYRDRGASANECVCTWVDPIGSAELMSASYRGDEIDPCIQVMAECARVHGQ
jgi:hypothetical protein